MMYDKTKQPNICAVVIGKTLSEFINNLDHIQSRFFGKIQMVELRVDSIDGIRPQDLRLIKESLRLPAIVTCRPQKFGGEFSGGINKLQEIYDQANKLGFDYIDIDSGNIDKINLFPKLTKVVVSFHDFENTPSLRALKTKLTKMRKTYADVYKFATMVNSNNEVQNLYQLLITKKSNERLIVLGMGDKGKPTRVISPLLGGFLTFAATGLGASAPGQIDVDSLVNIYEEIYGA